MLNLVCLPATEPGDTTYGSMPQRTRVLPAAAIHHVHFSTMVWYNAAVRKEAVKQIRALRIRPVVLVGFSKSGLGAWNIARTHPKLISGTIIFDAPVATEALPPWGTTPFYADDDAWQEDLPIRTVAKFKAAVKNAHSLVLVSGSAFHAEMAALSGVLAKAGVDHTFLSRPHMKHHWESGWLDEALNALVAIKDVFTI